MALHLLGDDAQGHIDYSQDFPVDGDASKARWQAALVAFGILEGRWREPHIDGEVAPLAVSAEAGGGNQASRIEARLVEETVFLRVIFHGLRDWQLKRARLERVPGVRDMEINSLSPRGADVRLRYPGGAGRLQSQLSSYGFSLEEENGGLVLR